VIRGGLYFLGVACAAGTIFVWLGATAACQTGCDDVWGILITGFAFTTLLFLAGWAHGRG
jgi:hypothetical protein